MDSGTTPFFNRLDEYRNTPQPPSDWHTPTPDKDGEAVASAAELEQNGLEMRSAYSRVGLALFLYALIPQILAYGFSYIGVYFFPELWGQMWVKLLVSDVVMYLIGAPICLLAMGMPKRRSAVAREKLPLGAFFTAICVVEAVSIVGSMIGNGLMGILSSLANHNYDNTLNTLIDGLSLPLLFFSVVILGPIMEEIVFRYAPLKRLLPYGEFRAVLVTSVIFGIAHGNFFQFFYCVAGGTVFGYLYTRTRNIAYSIALHMVFNFFGGFLPTLLERLVGTEGIIATLSMLLYALFLYGLALVGIILLCLFFRKICFRPAEVALPETGNGKRIWLNGGMIALMTVSVIIILLSLIPVA